MRMNKQISEKRMKQKINRKNPIKNYKIMNNFIDISMNKNKQITRIYTYKNKYIKIF